MANRRQNRNSSVQEDTNFPIETSTRIEETFKWTYNRERIFIDLYDQAIAMDGYRFKDPTPLGREFLVEKFNKEFNLNINYRFFKEKLDQLKRKYKKYKQLLQGSTGITVDPVTSVISASDSWWKDREVCKIVKSFKRKPPDFWDVMQRCFILHDVQSQSQYSVHQRREELMNEGIDNDESQVPETQENEEVYRVNINDETRPSNEFTQDHLQHNSSHAPPIHTPASRVQQQGGLRREVVHKEGHEAHESLLEVVHEEVVENSHLRQP
ncbi:PREDICTED: uncharacterized protein LOC104767164 isoform X2 [Camelina sativa]|uniref:Uncharacterized protein LOC104767164 isoform X2 n=1 Tax=Camelina sativa TaxID=90675 RepID=A0ABM1RCE1_CAMSA|nr:PREDICTED: uncharacterized protein LOC104767164 isoform X2 [Camelina sativa]